MLEICLNFWICGVRCLFSFNIVTLYIEDIQVEEIISTANNSCENYSLTIMYIRSKSGAVRVVYIEDKMVCIKAELTQRIYQIENL